MTSFNDRPVVLATNLAENTTQEPRLYFEPSGTYETAGSLFDGHTATFAETESITSSGMVPTHARLDLYLSSSSFDTVVFHGEFEGATEIKVYADSELLRSGLPTSRRAIFTEQKTASYVHVEVYGDGKFKFFQVWVGNRIELPNKGTRPYSPTLTSSSVADFTSDTGAMSRYAFYSGRLELEFNFIAGTDAEAQKYEDLFKESAYGSKPVYWIEDPDTAPEKPVLMFLGIGLGLTYTGPRQRETSFTLSEQGPRFLSSEA